MDGREVEGRNQGFVQSASEQEYAGGKRRGEEETQREAKREWREKARNMKK